MFYRQIPCNFLSHHTNDPILFKEMSDIGSKGNLPPRWKTMSSVEGLQLIDSSGFLLSLQMAAPLILSWKGWMGMVLRLVG